MNFPKITVVTITYGHAKYIAETLDSVLMQDYPGEVEFIIANDNSPDSTDEIIKEYFARKFISKNVIINYTKHVVNKGMMPNFVWALGRATGKYVALCEGDDYWSDPSKLTKQVMFLEENVDYSFCTHRFTRLRDGFKNDLIYKKHLEKKGNILYEDKFYNDKDIIIDYEMFYKTWVTQPLTTMYRNKYTHDLIVFSQKFTHFRDVHFFYYLLQQNNGFSLNQYMAVYRQHPSGEESGKSKIEKYFVKKEIWKELFEMMPDDKNLRAQYIETTLRLMMIVDNKIKFQLYKEIIKICNDLHYFMKINYQLIASLNMKKLKL